LYSIDQGAGSIPTSSFSVTGSTVKYAIMAIDGSYEGKLSPDGNSITGTWTQGNHPLPLNLKRATPGTEWAIPEAPARPKPMPPDANPVAEVATIKPSKPDQKGKGFIFDGHRFKTINTSLLDLLTFAYGVQQRQVIGGPPWSSSDKYDLEMQPDIEGMPNDKQLKSMLQKLLPERVKLQFHHEQKELPVYALLVAKSGQKMTKSQGDPNGLPGLFFRGLGVLSVQNATMTDFAGLMQSAVLDRPVVNQTALPGRYDFLLKWTPDESQFGGMGIKVPPPSNAADAPPNLFTAVQDELGLKFDATKASVDVLVIDHLEKPSAN
ncbi:MAG TPA: TIGR03435 family protein, partial [Bryobacteraceae bacterium]